MRRASARHVMCKQDTTWIPAHIFSSWIRMPGLRRSWISRYTQDALRHVPTPGHVRRGMFRAESGDAIASTTPHSMAPAADGCGTMKDPEAPRRMSGRPPKLRLLAEGNNRPPEVAETGSVPTLSWQWRSSGSISGSCSFIYVASGRGRTPITGSKL